MFQRNNVWDKNMIDNKGKTNLSCLSESLIKFFEREFE